MVRIKKSKEVHKGQQWGNNLEQYCPLDNVPEKTDKAWGLDPARR